MFISDFAIQRPVITIVTMLVLVVFGMVALIQLDTDEFPDVQPPIVAISIPYPGASPDTVEREVVDPLEEVVSGISGVDQINSSSLDSFGNIIVQFVFEKDLQQATQDIRDEISGIRNDLPPEMEEPILTRFDPADLPIVSLTLSSPTLTGPELTRIADPDITRRLRGIQGVGEVKVVGGDRARADGRAAAARSAGVRRQRRPGRRRRCRRRTSPRRSAGSNRRARRADDPAARPPRGAGRFRAARRVPANGRDRPARRRRRRPRRHRRAALARRSTTARRRSASTS